MSPSTWLWLAASAWSLPAPDARIARVAATADSLVLTIEGAADGVEIRIRETLPFDELAPNRERWVIWQGRPAGGTVAAPRFDGKRDRLFSGFSLDDDVRLRHVDDLSRLPGRQASRERASSIKGLQCIVDLDDAIALGVRQAAHNVSLGSVLDLSGGEKAEAIEVDGAGVGLNEAYLRQLDDTLSRLTAAGAENTIIFLNYIPRSRDGSNPLIHPETDVQAMPNGLGAFNLTSERGYLCYRAAIEVLARRYSGADAKRGRISRIIIGNEIQAHWWWYNLGKADPESVISDYARAVRVASLAAATVDRGIEVFISMDHHWTAAMDPDRSKFIPGRQVLDGLARRTRDEGDFPFGVAFHPYPENLFDPRSWRDRQAHRSFDTPKITFKNIEVLVAYLREASLLHEGAPRRIILSEQGLHRPDGPDGDQLQAAGYAYAYSRIRAIDGIDAFILHRHADHPAEGGLRLGIWPDLGGAKPNAARKRPLHDVFREADTPGWEEAFQFAKPLIGISDWSEVLPSTAPIPESMPGATARASASSSAAGFDPGGAIDGARFAAEAGAAWKGAPGASDWWWQVEFQRPRSVGSILLVMGDDTELFQDAPARYVWQWSPDGSQWLELPETRVVGERRIFRVVRLRQAVAAKGIRLAIQEAAGSSPAVREVEVYPGTDSVIDFPDWIVAVATDVTPNLRDASAFIRLAHRCRGWEGLVAQRVWLDSFDEALIAVEPRPLCAFLTGNYRDWCEAKREAWRGTQQVLRGRSIPMWAACGGAQGLAIVSEYGVDREWDCPHCRDPKNPKTPNYTHIGDTAKRPCGDYSACVHELGPTNLLQVRKDPVFAQLPRQFQAVESHCGQIERPPPGWTLLVTRGDGAKTATQCMRVVDRPIYAAQFHMEMDGSPETSLRLMSSFLREAKSWGRRGVLPASIPEPAEWTE